jgi:hypothetical protein
MAQALPPLIGPQPAMIQAIAAFDGIVHGTVVNWRQSIQGLLMREADWPLIRQANQLVYTYEQAQAFYILGYLGEPDICHETLEVALPVMAFLDWCCPAVPGIRNNFLDGQVYPQNVGDNFIQHSIRVPIAAAVPGVPQVGIIAQQGFVAAVPPVPAVYGPIPRYAAIHPVQGAANRTALATGPGCVCRSCYRNLCRQRQLPRISRRCEPSSQGDECGGIQYHITTLNLQRK